MKSTESKVKVYKLTKITDYYKPNKINEYNIRTENWHCTICGISMGKNNPRQLCGKTVCEN